jgi:amino acid transporter
MPDGLRRDLGTLESYAALIGILIGAGIFKVTGEAWALTGPSVILAYIVLAPMILATSVAYSVFLSTPLGRLPGGEYTHLSRTFNGYGLAFVGAWLKMISYCGALAYLARTFADYLLAPFGGSRSLAMPVVAIASLAVFYVIHVAGVRFFGRLQVVMCAILVVSLAVLIVPGLFAIHFENYRPFFTHGLKGFAASLAPLFFAYAGFESLAQTAGEVQDSTSRLPRIFLRGITISMVLYFLISAVAFGVLPGPQLGASAAPMAEVGARYLPAGAAWIVTVGALMAISTSINATMLVPSRIAVMLVDDGLAPRIFGRVSARTGTPILGLTFTFLGAVLLLVTGRVSLALNIALLALVTLYLLHSFALVVLPRTNPALYASVTLRLPRSVQLAAAYLSIVSMATLIVLLISRDVVILLACWGAIGTVLYFVAARRRARDQRSASVTA